jgi:murein L,D-transpeptidase YafK
MRNWGCALLILPLLVLGAGCAGTTQESAKSAALIQPESAYVTPKTHLTPDQKLVKAVLTKNGYDRDGSKATVILVHKASRKLTLYEGLTPIKTFPVVLGNDPYNDKLCQGDTCTPEGVYRIRAKYPNKRWDYFIWLDYPNTQNWLKFARAKKAGQLPPDAEIGGDVGIHGTEDPSRNLEGINWTKGCISLLNQDLEEIYPLVTDKTLVVIKKP